MMGHADRGLGGGLAHRLRRLAGGCGVVLLAVLGSAGPASAADPAACPNAQFRTGASVVLPDCRAFEKVSPSDKNGGDPFFRAGLVQASPDGSRAAYVTPSSFGGGGGAPRTSDYIAERSDSGWTTKNVIQPGQPDPMGGQIQLRFSYRWMLPDLSAGVFIRNDGPGIARNLWRQDFDADTSTRITPDPVAPLDPFSNLFGDMTVADASVDGSHLLFESQQQLTPDAPAPTGAPHLYEAVDGHVEFVGVLPDGGAAPSSYAGRGSFPASAYFEQLTTRTMSDDGSRIYFTDPTSTPGPVGISGEIYLREGGHTVQVSASQRTDCAGDPTCGGDGEPDAVADPDGPGRVQFEWATPDGSVAFISTCRKLTDDSAGDCSGGSAFGNKADVYRYDVASGGLQDITANLGGSARVVGVSDDGSTVYLYNIHSPDQAMYVWHDGQLTRIGDANTGAGENFSQLLTGERQVQVSADGRYLLWLSPQPLTGVDTGGHFMLYLYDWEHDHVSCVSCPTDGSAATSPATVTAFTVGVTDQRQYAPQAIDRSGRWVFFSTQEALVAQDTNDRSDVYQYDIATGAQRLISGGTQPGDAYFGDSTPDASTVLIVTDQRLTAEDQDQQRDVYAVRENGGFVEPVPAPAPCQGDACRGPSNPVPAPPLVGSLTFQGPGDPPPAPVAPSASVAVSKLKTITGSSATLTVKVPVAGQITAAGTHVSTATRVASKAGSFHIKIALSSAARKSLTRHRALKAKVKVTLRPRTGNSVSRTLTIAFRQAKQAGR